MDILAHSLWTNLMYKGLPPGPNEGRTTRWGIFFGIFPDLFAFAPGFVYIFFGLAFKGQRFAFGRPNESSGGLPLDKLSHQLYNYSHSLVIWLVIFFLIWIVWKKVPLFLLGWALHIGIDIFSHSTQFYPTPFLWPVSNFHVNGYPWGEPVFMIVNYSLLLLVYLFLIPHLKRTRQL